MSLPIPVFFDTEPQAIVDRMVSRYEELTGRTLQPAQVERLLFNTMGYELSLVRTAADEAAKTLLADFSAAPVIDYLARNVGLGNRLAPAKAYCTIRFTLVDGHAALIIPEGLRVQTTDGQQIFATKEATSVASGVNEIDIECESQIAGLSANGYTAGAVSVILDPEPYISTATNTTVTTGGSDEETDEQLRQRIFLAFAQSATAGSYSSYKLFALSANPLIVDVYVTSPNPGTVAVYPMVAGGDETPQTILDQVFSVLDAEDVRPLTDTVLVNSPSPVDYALDVSLTILTTANQQLIVQQVTANLNAFVAERATKLGLDITLDQITALCMVDGVYSVDINDPSADAVVEPNEFAVNTGVSVTVSSIVNG